MTIKLIFGEQQQESPPIGGPSQNATTLIQCRPTASCLSMITCSKNVFARPCIFSYVQLEHDNNRKIAIYAMHRRRQVHLSPVSWTRKQKCLIAYKKRKWRTLFTLSKTVEHSKISWTMSIYRDRNKTQNVHVCAVGRRPGVVDDDVISSRNVNSIEGYGALNF